MRIAALWFPNPPEDFEQVIGQIETVAATVEMIRVGLAVIDIAAAGRFHGSEDTAAQLIIDAGALPGVDCFLGIADELATALLAAHCATIVPPGHSATFLASQPLELLTAEPALDCDSATVHTLCELGIRTLGHLATMDTAAVVTRFGQAGRRCLDIARAAPDRRIRAVHVAQPLTVTTQFDEPVTRVDAAAFAARHLAIELMKLLAHHGVLCTRLKVHATIGETVCERIWRTHDAVTEQIVVDRVRWQLEGWLGAHHATGGLTELTLEPVSVHRPDDVPLWQDVPGDQGTEHMQQVISRVQALYGVDSVLTPRRAGGRSPVEQVELIPYGEEREPSRPVEGRWWGAILPPYPAARPPRHTAPHHPVAQAVIVDTQGSPVQVDGEGLLTATPIGMGWGNRKYVIDGWAGPWPVGYQARMQVVGHEPYATTPHGWLLLWNGQRWSVEAIYG